ncbi:MAG: hypothetical protein ABW277_03030 [Longimicrobiaceae bacterium]
MQQAFRAHGHISQDGTLKLENLPFEPGEEVEVIVLAEARTASREGGYPLRGAPLVYEDPTGPVGDSDWEASR